MGREAVRDTALLHEGLAFLGQHVMCRRDEGIMTAENGDGVSYKGRAGESQGDEKGKVRIAEGRDGPRSGPR